MINGGQVTATAASSGTAIGSGDNGASGGSLTLGWTNDTDFVEVKRWSNSDRPFGGFSSVSFAENKYFYLSGTTTLATPENINQAGTDVRIVPAEEPLDISNAVISGVNSHYAYTGSDITITPTVTLLGKVLSASTDYTVSYKRNGEDTDEVKETGSYTLTVTGEGTYSGRISTAFCVNAPVSYQAYENDALTDKTLAYDEYVSVTAATTAMTSGWYVVVEDVTISNRITTSGNVNLVLCNGASLTAQKGISVLDGSSFTVYGQNGNTGALVATGRNEQLSSSDFRRCAGIGGDGWGLSGSETAKAGTIIIHGGTITARSAAYGCSGIGKAYDGEAGNITIYGGKVTANGDATGIGGSGATIHLGWANQSSDFIESSGYDGTVIFDKVFVLSDDHNVTATAENAGGRKIIPLLEENYTVTFNSNGGSDVPAQNVVRGQATPEPGKPM